MSPPVRVPLLLGALVLTAGCLSGFGVDPPASPTPATPTATGTATPVGNDATETATPSPVPDFTELSEVPQPQSVDIENRWNRSVQIRVRVVRQATGRTVHDRTYRLSPRTDRDVFDTATVETDGVEAFTVVLTARNTTERVTVETSKCHGGVYGGVTEDGSVELTYAVC